MNSRQESAQSTWCLLRLSVLLLQGIQLSYDSDEYGGFMDSLLVPIRDELPKLPSIVFLSMSQWDPKAVLASGEAGHYLARLNSRS